jgi:dienelactone hydrolase
MRRLTFLVGTWLAATTLAPRAQSADTTRGDQIIAAYFRQETRKLADACLVEIQSWDDWSRQRETYCRQLREMLGLDPLPERTPLNPVITGKLEHANFTVEKVHFQSRPGLYVTANLYLPKNPLGPAPAILYVCGHSPVKKDGISYGNKVGYQHHGAWLAGNGYVCLVIDTIQLGEIEGIHHGTYRENMWWWNARGYTPAGVEAWNAMRAIDYLVSRPEVDASRIGITGRSGGGAYSWYTAALDERIKAVVPVAGITNLEDHVVHGCVEGHCDCMYFVNTYRWDHAQVAALVAPRPLLVANTDRDDIFPLEGVLDVHRKVRHLYRLHGKPEDIGLQIAAGRHADLQVLQLHALAWFNEHLRGDESPVETVAKAYFEPEQLKVFDRLPEEAINARIHETFVPPAPAPAVPESGAQWQAQRNSWLAALREKCFAGWPAEDQAAPTRPRVQLIFDQRVGGARYCGYDFDSQQEVTLQLYLVLPGDIRPAELPAIELHPLDAAGWDAFVAALPGELATKLPTGSVPTADPRQNVEMRQAVLSSGHGLCYVAPRGIGPTAWDADPRKQTHTRRRFMLLGQTLDGMRVWDLRRTIQALRAIEGLANVPLWIGANGEMAGISLYAALFEPGIKSLTLRGLSNSHRNGPDFLNVLRVLDVPQAVAMAAERSLVRMIQAGDESAWTYPLAVAEQLGWSDRVEFHDSTGEVRRVVPTTNGSGN